jgi:hypothetical protein
MQFSLFGAAVAEPTRADLDGLVLAGGSWVRAGGDDGDRARLSVLVDSSWRAQALVGEFAARDLDAESVPVEGATSALVAVRTPFRADLVVAAQRWTKGARYAPPPDLALAAGGLRLWTIAAGHRDDVGYLLGTADIESPVHRAAGAQLAALGLAAVGVGERGRPGWRITGLKRLRRFAELLGEPPAGAVPHWPA